MPRAIRICVLSTFLALVAFSFLAFGSASAHALSRSAGGAQTTSTNGTTYVRIITNTQGATVFSPAAITVKSMAAVRITDRTAYSKFVVVAGQLFHLAPGQGLTTNPTQSETVTICGGGGALSITVD